MSVKIVGAGAYVPDRVITNDRLVRAIPGPWSASDIEAKTGIRERRFLWDFDEASGRAIVPPNLDYPGPNVQVAEKALVEALASAGMQANELDGLYLVTCSPDELNFNNDALRLHERLGMRPDAFALVDDVGCGGALFHLQMAKEIILGGVRKTIAVVGVNVTSPYLDRDVFTSQMQVAGASKPIGAFLTMYLFGDGAGAMILRSDPGAASGFVASFAENQQLDLVVRRGGGAMRPPHPGRATPADHAYYVNGALVAQCFTPAMENAMQQVLRRAGLALDDISRFYLHQANMRLVVALAQKLKLPPAKVAMHMDRYGNTSAAGTLILLAEDLRNGAVRFGSGETVLFAAIGAGAQCAAHVIKL